MASREQKKKSKEKKKEQGDRSNLSLPDSHEGTKSRSSQATSVDSEGMSSILLTETKISGPLPSPNVLRDYDAVQPGFAERIFAMAEKEQGARHKFANRTNVAENFGKVAGLCLAGVITLVGIGGSFFLIYADKSLEGFGTLLIALAVLVGSAAYRHRISRVKN